MGGAGRVAWTSPLEQQRAAVGLARRTVARSLECAALFLVLPLLFYLAPSSLPKIPFLLAALLFCVVTLRRDRSFDRRLFWNGQAVPSLLPGILLRTGVAAAALAAYVAATSPGQIFAFPRHHPFIWALVMLLYPLLSAYPQELIYRTFFFHRYAVLFQRPWVCIAASTVAFSLLHLMYDNVFAVASTLAAGAVLSVQYARTRSLAAVSLEHALYGCLVFTVGLGRFFYEGW